MGNKQYSEREKDYKERNIWKILRRQTNEMLEVTTLEEFNECIVRHKRELPKLLEDEVRRFESSIKSYDKAVKDKRNELEEMYGEELEEDRDKRSAVGKLRF